MEEAHAIIAVARELARSMPAPRGAPYFCLDTDATYDLRVFDSLSARGIFRKYEFALEIGSGLGGRTRWLANRNACRIVGVDPSPERVAAATMLNRRAHMDDQVLFQVGRLDHLPLRERIFTHVWLLDVAGERNLAAVTSEAYRVLRGGGHFALQTFPLPPGQRQALLDTLREVGFQEIEARQAPLSDAGDACRIARERLRAQLPSRVAEARTRRDPFRLQIFARRLA